MTIDLTKLLALRVHAAGSAKVGEIGPTVFGSAGNDIQAGGSDLHFLAK
jgi:hypothetical protein